MRPFALTVIAATLAFVPTSSQAQRYFARVKISGTASTGSSAAPPGIAKCGSLVKGDWFVDYQHDTGLVASTLAEAQTACDSLATKSAGSCGWTNDPFYPASFRNKVYWTQLVETRQYNIPSNTEGFVWAVTCPIR